MPAASSPAESLFQEVLKQGVTPPLKEAGFRKKGTNYHRRAGSVVQVVQIQSSHGSSPDQKIFYVNVGLAFDAICRLAAVPILEQPKEYECDARGTRDRLENLIPGAPESWLIQAGENPAGVAARLSILLRQLTTELDKLHEPAAYRSHRWFERFRPTATNAQVLYLLGNLDEARREVEALARLFADRQNACNVEWWIEKLSLHNLKPNSP